MVFILQQKHLHYFSWNLPSQALYCSKGTEGSSSSSSLSSSSSASMSLWIIIKGEGGQATPGCTVKVGTLTDIKSTSDQIFNASLRSGRNVSHLLVPNVCPPSLILSRSCGGGRGTMTGSGSGASAKPWCFLLCFLCFLCFRLWTLCKLVLPSPA